MKQCDLLMVKKLERNNFLEWQAVLSTNCKITEQSAVRGGRHKSQGFFFFLLRNSSLLVRAKRDRRGGEMRGTNGGTGKEGQSAVGLESCFSFSPDIFTQKHPSGAVVIMEHKIA